MSTYYRFYVGYKTKDDKCHLFGPYNKFGKLRPVIERSRSFIGNFIDDFIKMDESQMDDEIKKEFGYESPLMDSNYGTRYSVYYIDANELPSTNFIKSGYYKAEEVLENMNDDEKYFSESYDEKEYSFLLQKAVRADDKEEIERLKEFIYYCYPDYLCDNYIASVIESSINWNGPFGVYEIEDALKKHNAGEYKSMIIIMEIC